MEQTQTQAVIELLEDIKAEPHIDGETYNRLRRALHELRAASLSPQPAAPLSKHDEFLIEAAERAVIDEFFNGDWELSDANQAFVDKVAGIIKGFAAGLPICRECGELAREEDEAPDAPDSAVWVEALNSAISDLDIAKSRWTFSVLHDDVTKICADLRAARSAALPQPAPPGALQPKWSYSQCKTTGKWNVWDGISATCHTVNTEWEAREYIYHAAALAGSPQPEPEAKGWVSVNDRLEALLAEKREAYLAARKRGR